MKGFLIAATIGMLAVHGQNAPEYPTDVSMIQLIATPERYDEKKVRVIGYLRLEFEGNALYLHKEDHLRGLVMNAIWFDAPKKWEKKPEDFSNRYVLVEGTFDDDSRGHGGMFAARITSVTRVEVWDH